MSYELSVIVPTRNDAATIESVLIELNEILIESGISVEVTVVDDHSNDGTVEIGLKAAALFPWLHIQVLGVSRRSLGFGSLIRFGLAYSTGRFVVLVSADGSDPAELIPPMVSQLRLGSHLVVCSRYPEDTSPDMGRRARIYRRIYRRSIRVALGQDVLDSTYGFRAFDRAFVTALGLSSNRYSVCPEMTFKTVLVGGRITFLEGRPRQTGAPGNDRFKISHEMYGYAGTLSRAALHRVGVTWF